MVKVFTLVVSWIVSLFLLLSGIATMATMATSFGFGLILVIGGIITLPLINGVFKKYKININSWIRVLVALILFVFGIAFLYDDSEIIMSNNLTNEEVAIAISDLETLNNKLLITGAKIIDYCEEIYGEDQATEECESYYDGIYGTEVYIQDLIKILKEETNIPTIKYSEDIEIINESIQAIENAEESLQVMKDLLDLDKEIEDKTNINDNNSYRESNNSNNNSGNSNNSTSNITETNQRSKYEEILDEYTTRLKRECPTLSMMECAELANEGVIKMAEYMYTARGVEGQYATYEKWAGKLMEVYMQEAR